MTVSGPAAAVATAGLVVAVDQATKQLAATNVAIGDKVDVVPGLDFTSTRNTGVAFGALEGGGLVVAILIGASLALLVAYFVANREQPWLWLPVGMLLGGRAGQPGRSRPRGSRDRLHRPDRLAGLQRRGLLHRVGVVVLLWVVEGSRERRA